MSESPRNVPVPEETKATVIAANAAATPPTKSDGDAQASIKNVRAGCLVFVVVLAVAAALAIWLSKDEKALEIVRVAYFTPPVDIDKKTKVMFHSEEVGRIDSVQPNFKGFQFVVYDLKTWVRAIGTLPSDLNCGINLHDVDIQYDTFGVIIITNGGGKVRVERDLEGNWRFQPGANISSFRLARYRKSIDALAADTANNTMRDGDKLLLATAQLEWRNPAVFTRVVVKIDTGKVKKLAGDAFNIDSAIHYIGPGTELALASNFGLSRPSLKLIPSIETTPFARIENLIASETIDASSEIIGNSGFDFEGFLAGGANYLMAPNRLGAPPRNNFERIVADVYTATDTLAAMTADTRRMTLEASDYLSNPAYLNTEPKTRLQTAVADINVTLSNMKTLEATIRRAVRSADNMIGNIDHTTRPVIESTLQSVRADLRLITVRIDQISTTLEDTTLVQLDQTLVKATADIDQLTEDIHRLSRTLNQLVQQISVTPR